MDYASFPAIFCNIETTSSGPGGHAHVHIHEILKGIAEEYDNRPLSF